MQYEHTQRGRLTIFVALFFVVMGLISIPSVIDEEPAAAWVILAAMLLIVGMVALFSRLTVTVDSRQVAARFGWGWPRRLIQHNDVVAVRQVRNAWIYGWGVRWIPGGAMFNVWGRDAVELDLASGRKFRIGTDDPEALLAAVRLYAPDHPSAA